MQDNQINKASGSEDLQEPTNEAFFSKYPQLTKRHFRMWRVLNYIRANPYHTTYQIASALHINPGIMHRDLKDLVYCDIVACKPGTNKWGAYCELFFLPEVA